MNCKEGYYSGIRRMSNSYCQLRPTVNHFIKQVVRGMGYSIYTRAVQKLIAINHIQNKSLFYIIYLSVLYIIFLYI